MLQIYSGRNRLLAPALAELLRGDDAETQLVVVPKQLTLQTERMLLEALELRGSFRMQVLSAERLCGRIFDAAGQPDGVRIDDRGRVMLVRAAVRAAQPELTVYRGAERRRGFPERCAAQLERIRQAGIAPDALRACAAEQSGTARLKLNDLSHILESYESLIEGRYQDGEAEFNAAIVRARDAAFLRTCSVWFFGFDMVPPTLYDLIAAVAAVCPRAGILMPLENDVHARDFDAFVPMERACNRLLQSARRAGAQTERIEVREAGSIGPGQRDAAGKGNTLNIARLLGHPEEDQIARTGMDVAAPGRKADLKRLEEELFAYPMAPASGPAKSVQLTLARNPQEECMFAAALARRLVMRRGWRWDDILILCRDVDGYAAPLRAAFATYDVPLFLSASRPAARHALAECLLTALRVIEKNYPAEDMFALLRTELLPIDRDEADRLTNYAVKYGLRGTRFLHPLRRGGEAEIDALEPVRARAMEPLIHLRDRLRRAEVLQQQLEALFAFLTEIDAYDKSQDHINLLAEQGLREAAGEEGQVWNRILGALDQMYALLGEAKLPLSELRETLTESLSASVIKALPQSGDAVYAQSTESACTRGAKAILLLGMSDRPVSDDEGLLTPSQKEALSRFTQAYLGPGDEDLSLLRRFYLKSALGMATDYVSLSCPLSGMDGSAQRPGALFEMIEGIFPGTKCRGGLTGDAGVERMLRGAPKAAVACAAKALAGEAEGVPCPDADRAALAGLKRIAQSLPQARAGLERLSAALNRAQAADSLSPGIARSLYGTLSSQSITQLEMFASCPFSYYARYGLKPEKVEPFELNARDEGTFFHAAVNEFLLRSMDDLGALDADEAALRMDAISEPLLSTMGESGPLGDSAVSLAERRRLKATARTCAQVLSEHMRGSRFHTAALEQGFGRDDGPLALTLPGGCVLEGRIDRVDEWQGDDGRYLRVIDYKRSGKALNLAQTYYGLRLQLPIYLAASLRRREGKSAGVYYFPLSEGILSTQATDPGGVAAQRRKAFRMEGLLPEDPNLLEAMSPDFFQVLKVRVSASGAPVKGTLTAGDGDYRRIAGWALHQAAEHVKRIRSGECRAAPARMEQSNPCQYCDYREACLFDDRLDADKVRTLKPLSGEEVLLRLATQDAPKDQKIE